MPPKLYHQLSIWWPLLSPPEEYAEELEFYANTLEAAGTEPARTMLGLRPSMRRHALAPELSGNGWKLHGKY